MSEGSSNAAITKAGAHCDSGADPVQCYEGEAGTEGVGTCRAGMRFCASGEYTRCLDQVVPAIESCNGMDDDCNGDIDDIADQSCQVSGAVGGCGVAGAIVCRDGAPSCELTQLTGVESCNGADDDCDGSTDENIAGTCFPNGATGCEQQSNGLFACLGVCVTGTLSCTGGMEQCTGATTADVETCGDSPALDEDCDGLVDENCSCISGTSQNCYAGPLGAIAEGETSACGQGTQTCTSGTMGPCMSQTLPVPEDCANQGTDDDCNGVVDDVKGLDTACTAWFARGACRVGTLQCRPGIAAARCVSAPSRLRSCATRSIRIATETRSTASTSTATCAAARATCSASPVQDCCGGKCVSPTTFMSDRANCGACGVACGSYQVCCQGQCSNPSSGDDEMMPPGATCCAQDCGPMMDCCGTKCVDLDNDDYNCGTCGHECPADLWCIRGECGQN